MTAKEMRERARQYRTMVIQINDARAQRVLLDLAAEYEAIAEQIEASEDDDEPA